MQKQENNSNNQLQILALSNISWQKWQLKIFVAKVHYTVLQTGLMKKKHELLAAGKPFNEALLGAQKNMPLNVPC